MRTFKILVPVDIWEPEDSAIEYAASIAKEKGGQLLLVHSHEATPTYCGDKPGRPREPSADEMKQLLWKMKPTDPSVPIEYRLLFGDPALLIPQLAEDEGIDLIVVSSHGRMGIMRVLLGSVAEAILRRARCPVVVCKPKATATF